MHTPSSHLLLTQHMHTPSSHLLALAVHSQSSGPPLTGLPISPFFFVAISAATSFPEVASQEQVSVSLAKTGEQIVDSLEDCNIIWLELAGRSDRTPASSSGTFRLNPKPSRALSKSKSGIAMGKFSILGIFGKGGNWDNIGFGANGFFMTCIFFRKLSPKISRKMLEMLPGWKFVLLRISSELHVVVVQHKHVSSTLLSSDFPPRTCTHSLISSSHLQVESILSSLQTHPEDMSFLIASHI